MLTCPFCGVRPLYTANQYVSTTCLNSYCQQTSVEQNLARFPRKKTKKK